MGAQLGLVWAAPFVGMLLSIALCPLLTPHFWHRHFPKVSLAWALVMAGPFLILYRGAAWHAILHTMVGDYVPFVILLWALFTISGGILLRGTLRPTPVVNSLLLLVGTMVASWIGTTGASMLLIRPLLRANEKRLHKTHTVVFFIFLVSNIGGLLTPLGDPPLFLGFLHYVPFFWTLENLWPHMLVAVGVVLGVYFLLDLLLYAREPHEAKMAPAVTEPLRLEGWHNLLFMAGVVGAVLLSGWWKPQLADPLPLEIKLENLVRDALLVLMGIASLATTRRNIRAANGFGWGPIKEVAILFFGIFITIIPALMILAAGDKGDLAWLVTRVRTEAHFFWASGILSSFLDNAPTYLTFLATVLGRFCGDLLPDQASAVAQLIARHNTYLQAIAVGSVFMGANTYIGNAPNFMVRSIAEEAGVKMPDFFSYIFKYSLPVLIPTFVLITYLFFGG